MARKDEEPHFCGEVGASLCLALLFLLSLLAVFVVSGIDYALFKIDDAGASMRITNCNANQLLPPPAVAAYYNIDPLPAAQLLTSNSSWYLGEWSFGNDATSSRDFVPGMTLETGEIQWQPLCPAQLTSRHGVMLCANSQCTYTENTKFNTHCMEAGNSHISTVWKNRILAPFASLNNAQTYDSDIAVSTLMAESILCIICFPPSLFGAIVLAYAVFITNCFKLAFILSITQTATINAWKAEMFPSCTVIIELKSQMHYSIVMYVFVTLFSTLLAPFLLALCAFLGKMLLGCMCADDEGCCSLFNRHFTAKNLTPPIVSISKDASDRMYQHVSAKLSKKKNNVDVETGSGSRDANARSKNQLFYCRQGHEMTLAKLEDAPKLKEPWCVFCGNSFLSFSTAAETPARGGGGSGTSSEFWRCRACEMLACVKCASAKCEKKPETSNSQAAVTINPLLFDEDL